MSFGVPLSQLIVETPKPIPSGISELDHELDGGFKYRAIYEIYGPPGIGRSWLGTEIMNRFLERDKEGEVLWIVTHDSIPSNVLKPTTGAAGEAEGDEENRNNRIKYLRIRKFTELLYFYQRSLDSDINHRHRESSSPPAREEEKQEDQQEDEQQQQQSPRREEKKSSSSAPRLVIIDGFSKLVTNQLDCLEKRQCTTMHDSKCRYLIIIMTLLTKFNNRNGSCHILLDDCMNTAYNPEVASAALNEDLETVEDGFNFFVRSQNFTYENNKRRRLHGAKHVLRSALVANNAMGHRDSRWEIFIKRRVGLFWEWSNGKKCRVALVENSSTSLPQPPSAGTQRRLNKISPPAKNNFSAPFDISGHFIYD